MSTHVDAGEVKSRSNDSSLQGCQLNDIFAIFSDSGGSTVLFGMA